MHVGKYIVQSVDSESLTQLHHQMLTESVRRQQQGSDVWHAQNNEVVGDNFTKFFIARKTGPYQHQVVTK